MIRGLYHYFGYYNHNVQRDLDEFTPSNFKQHGFDKAVKNIRDSLSQKGCNDAAASHARYWNFSEMIYKNNDKKISLIFYKLFGYKDSNIFS